MKRNARHRSHERDEVRDFEVDDDRPRILKAVSYGDRTYGPAQPERGIRQGNEAELAKVIRAEDIPRLKKEGAIQGDWRGATGVARRALDEAEWSSRPEWERMDMIKRGKAPSFVNEPA